MQSEEHHSDLPGMERLHRTAIRVGGIAAGFAGAAFVLWAVVAGEPYQLYSAIGPAIIAVAAFIMLRAQWYHAEIILAMSAVSTILSFKFAGADAAGGPAAMGIVVIISIGVLFVPRPWQRRYVLFGVTALFATGLFWHGLNNDGYSTGVSGAASGLVAMVLFLSMRNAAVSLDRRYRLLVERMPVPLVEHDWSMVRAWVKDCKVRGVTDMEGYLNQHPGVVEIMAKTIQLRGTNAAMESLTGDALAADPGDTRFAPNLEQFIPFVRREIISIFNGADPEPSDYRVMLEDGTELWTRLHAAELDDADIPDLDRVVAAIDITELKQAQARLAELVRSKDEFVAAVSHELRTPLTSVLGFAEVLMTDSARLSIQDREQLMLLQNQAYDMSHIVEDLLVAARAEIGTVPIDSQPLELAPLITETVGDLGHRFTIRMDDEPVVHADRVRVGQILRNLVTNATRYGGEERAIRIATNGTKAIVEVRDNGGGVAPDKRERIFEPYTRAHDRPGMTASVGLGLAVSRQLAELMGGALDYVRDDGESVFRLTLPLSEPATSDVA